MDPVTSTTLVKRRSWPPTSHDLFEYALLMGLIVAATLGGVHAVGGTVESQFWEYIANVVF